MGRLTAKQTAMLLGFLCTLIGTLGSFLFIELLNKDIRRLSGQRAAVTHEIELLQAASSEYYLSNQQGDLVYALSLQSTADMDLVASIYKGNLLDRATPIRNVIGSLALSKVLDYADTYARYMKLNEAARETPSAFDRFMAVKEFEREVVERAAQHTASLQTFLAGLNKRIEEAERRLASRRGVTLGFSLLGATLLLYANLLVEKRQATPAQGTVGGDPAGKGISNEVPTGREDSLP